MDSDEEVFGQAPEDAGTASLGVEDDRQSQLSFGRLGAATPATGTPGTSDSHSASGGSTQKELKVAKCKCPLCKKQQPKDTWPINCPHCRCCKQAIDNLAYAARSQQQMDWWKTTRCDPVALREVAGLHVVLSNNDEFSVV